MNIDAVFSGGGIKGYSLIGACQVLEEKGYTFKRLAGTSAGSIIAALLIAGYTSKEIEQLLMDIDIEKFMDERFGANLPIVKWLLLYKKLGLYKGDQLQLWLAEKLAAKGIVTFSDIPKDSLRIVVSDISNGEIVVLPDDLPKYQCDIATFSIAKAVRMSCSIPFFFEPVKLRCNKKTSYIVDGGVLSNFPLWLFDGENIKKVRPVIGITLTGESGHKPPKRIQNALEMFSALFSTMKEAHDNRYISRKHAKNIIFIPITRVSSSEFDITGEQKNELISLGKEYANQFLRKWTY
ncbi:patatin-like phospholipase family protein [Bacillus sp. AGMB 02131]|uniref:Patatin-like phospholipase family protein n=1 Tax=Peribacillus faecalis TaxID=2772559 RepID=A0A927HB45_9BACI|nr:patatin-like phospholipase family protein [Peribacillus faecalis]MBD3108111.1 patatin-like phospholipase family protein [Peribacillus faecalis]